MRTSIPASVLVGLVTAAAAPASAQQAAPNWAGAIRCDIQSQAPGYSHQESQTWTLTGAAPTAQGSVIVYPATWSVTGQGSHDRTGTSSRRVAQWTVSISGVNAPIGFTQHAGGRTFDVAKWHAQLTAGGAYAGTDQFINSGVPQTPARLAATVYEWQFPKIEADSTQTQLTGANTSTTTTQVGPLQPSGAQVTITCTWSLGRGSAAPLAPPPGTGSGASGGAVSGGAPAGGGGTPAPGAGTVAGGTPAGGTTGGAPAGGATGSGAGGATVGAPVGGGGTTAPGAGTVAGGTPAGGTTGGTPAGGGTGAPAGGAAGGGAAAGSGAAVLSVSPNSIEQGVSLSGVITLTGQGTTWQQGLTIVDFGPGIRIQGVPSVSSPTSLTVWVSVGYAAASGPRGVTATTGTEVATLPGALTIIARAQPVISQISPNSAPAGQQNLTVTLTGQGTRWAPGQTALILGPGIHVVGSPTVTSATQMTAVVNVDAVSPAGPRDVTVMNPGPFVASDIITVPGGFTIGPAPSPLSTATVVPIVPVAAALVADLSLSLTPQRPDFPAGIAVRHVVRVANSGPAAVSQAVLQAPPFVNVNKTGNMTCRSSDGSNCPLNGVPSAQLGGGIALPTVPAGGFVEVQFDVTVNGAPGDTVVYEAFVTPPQSPIDPDRSNNVQTLTQVVVAPPPSLTTIPVVPTLATGGTAGTAAAPTQPLAPPVMTATGTAPGSAPSGSANSGVYLVTVTGIICALPTGDTTMTGLIQVGDPDGRGDEVQAGAYIRRFDRVTQQLLEYGDRRSIPYGDITAGTGRLQAGTQTPTGGVRHGDWIPPSFSVSRASAAQDLAIPWKVWEGRLTDGVDVLAISPNVWEWDGVQDFYTRWVNAQHLLDQTILADQGVQNRIANQSLAPIEVGAVSYLGLGDRPIGLRRTGNGPVVPNLMIVLTREIIERALSVSAWAPTQIPVTGVPLAIPKPGILVLNFVEVPGDALSMPASYSLILQVEKLSN